MAGLRLGADDYLTKDISLPHLLARIAALFRRVDAAGTEAAAEDVVERGTLRLDTKRVTRHVGRAAGSTSPSPSSGSSTPSPAAPAT